MAKRNRSSSETSAYKTPIKPKFVAYKPQYNWTDTEKQKVIEGANKGWKETRIKNTSFPDSGPSKSQIKTLLQKLPFRTGGVANSGLANFPEFAQGAPKGNFETVHQLSKLNFSFSVSKAINFGFGDEPKDQEVINLEEEDTNEEESGDEEGCFIYWTVYGEKQLFVIVKDIPGADLSDLEATERGVTFKITIEGPPILKILDIFKIKPTNQALLDVANDLKKKEYVVSIKSKFKLALTEENKLTFEKWADDGVGYSIVSLAFASQVKEISKAEN